LKKPMATSHAPETIVSVTSDLNSPANRTIPGPVMTPRKMRHPVRAWRGP
jgi:hypothetical protein